MRRLTQKILAPKILAHGFDVYHALAAFVAASYYFYSASPSFATNSNMGTDLCQVLIIAQGEVAQDISILAVMILGVGAMLGKVSWGMAILVAVGISIVFNVGSIASALGVGNSCTGVT